MSLRIGIILVCAILASAACGPNQRILESSNANASSSEGPTATNLNAVPDATPSFEQDLAAMQTADFKFILVFRRKDGQPLDEADKGIIRETGFKENRRKLSDGGKAVIVGSNFQFLPNTFDELPERFIMQNYSKPNSGPMYSNSFPNE